MLVIGQNLNSSAPIVHQAMASGQRAWVEQCARAQVAAGADALDCCAASFGPSEPEVLRWLVEILEAVVDVPVCLDSPHAQVLVDVADRRRRPPILNSVDCEGPWPSPLVSAVRDGGAALILQLRRADGSIPSGVEDRLAWTERGLREVSRQRIDPTAVWIDPVLLPWADDVARARPLLDYLRRIAQQQPGLKTLVGLSNVSYGARERRRLHREWLARLIEEGLAGAILDPLESEVMALARGGR